MRTCSPHDAAYRRLPHPEWVGYFDLHHIASIHWSSVGAVDVEDKVIFEHASVRGYIVFTHDLDFGTLLAHAASHKPSVIQARVDDVTPGVLGPIILAALHQFREELERGAIVTILPDRTKARVLPI